MIGFQKIAGGEPASVGGMSAHLLNNTLGRGGLADIAAYYERGGPEPDIIDLARAVSDGRLDMEEAVALLMREHEARIPHPTAAEQESFMVMNYEDGKYQWHMTRDLDHERAELLFTIEGQLTGRLDALVDRFDQGLDVAHLAVVRQDIHPSVLIGLGIEADGILTGDQINALLAGRKADGKLIDGKKYSVERTLPINPKDGVRRWSTPIGSYDFCPTPDKTVSVAWAFGNQAEQAIIYAAHLSAARKAVAYIASEIGVARYGQAGQDGWEKGHVGWLEFTHHTARRVATRVCDDGQVGIVDDESAGDPDLHTHFLIPNAVFCDSGRVGSLDTAAIGGFVFEADAYYHAELAQALREEGFEVVLDAKTGAARMTAIPDYIRTLFSKRSLKGEAMARRLTEDRGQIWDDLSDGERQSRIKSATQSPEQRSNGQKDPVADVEDWKIQARQAGWFWPVSLRLYGPAERQLTGEELHHAAYAVALPVLAEKLEHEAVVPHWDLRLAALRGLIAKGITGLSDIGGVTKLMRERGVVQYGEHTTLISAQEPGERYTSITTALHESDELAFVRLARDAAADRSGAIPDRLLRRKIIESGLNLSDEHGLNQRRAIEILASSGRFSMVIAAAGAGKTTALKPLVAAWKEQGRDVWGTSLASRQTDDLVEAGIAQHHLRAFGPMVDTIASGEFKLTANSVLAIDEWATIGTRKGLELLQLRERYGFSIVALGDDKQTQAIDAGSVVDLSRRALGVDAVPVIVTTKRQQSDREQEIVRLLRNGEAADALAMKRADGTAEMIYGGPDGVTQRVAQLYGERLAATGNAPSISAPTNMDAHRISEAVRLVRRGAGLLGPDLRTVHATDGTRNYDMKVAAGDHIRLFQSTRVAWESRGGQARNGTVLEVLDANRDTLKVRTKTGIIGRVTWDKLAAPDGRMLLAYGSAMTIHTAQGSTAEEHIFAMPAGSGAITGASGYTAGTRHRIASYLVTSELSERSAVRQSRPVNDTHDITLDDKWANVARALAYQPEQDSALAMLERALQVRRWSADGLRRMSAPVGAPRSDVADSARLRHLGQTMAVEARGVARAVQRGLVQTRQAIRRGVSEGRGWTR